MRAAAAALLLARHAAGHGSMNYPPSRTGPGFCKDGSCEWYQTGCQPGCGCIGDLCYGKTAANAKTKCCDAVMEPTMANDSAMRTMAIDAPNRGPFFGNEIHVSPYNPWRSPGHGSVLNPCGLAGGQFNTTHISLGGGGGAGKYKEGFLGTSVPPLKGVKTVWKVGSQQEVAYTVQNNHGGGYAYRLCPLASPTEENCQKYHLEFAGDQTWIQFGDYDGTPNDNRTAIQAVRTTEGTNPPGSQWAKGPIPPCSGAYGGGVAADGCDKPQYDAPMQDVIPAAPWKQSPGIYGFGPGRCAGVPPGLPSPMNPKELLCTRKEVQFWEELFNFSIVDLVQVPADLPAGDYLLSFRWDCEQTPQIWTNCADITVTA